MREIKFRGQEKDSGKWIYGDVVHNAFNGSTRCFPVGIQQNNCYPTEVLPETVGQYTGLKDKNGKEIFEGDIVDNINIMGDDFGKSAVIFKDAAFGFKVSYGRGFYEPCLYEANDSFIEVIGNIYEHPDLLETKG